MDVTIIIIWYNYVHSGHKDVHAQFKFFSYMKTSILEKTVNYSLGVFFQKLA